MEILSYFSEYYQLWICVFIGLIILGYTYLTWEFDIWKRQGVPGETPRVFIGTLKPIWKTSIHDQDVAAMKKFGSVYGCQPGFNYTLSNKGTARIRQSPISLKLMSNNSLLASKLCPLIKMFTFQPTIIYDKSKLALFPIVMISVIRSTSEAILHLKSIKVMLHTQPNYTVIMYKGHSFDAYNELLDRDFREIGDFLNRAVPLSFIGRRPVLSISDPDLIKQVLVKDFAIFSQRSSMGRNFDKDELIGNMLSVMRGDKWKMVRNTLTPAYTSGKLKQMVILIEECLQNLSESILSEVENGEPIEFTKKFTALTLDIIASCAFGMKVNCIDNPQSEFIVNVQKGFLSRPILAYLMVIFPFVFKFVPKSFLPTPFNYFTKIANQTIDMRLKNKDFSRRDFLQIMLESEIPNEENENSEENQTTGSKKKLTREIIVAQTVLFILAGHETTANTSNFIVYELAQNQDVQEKLIKEVDEMMTHSKGKLTYEGIASMQYLDMVISETLRKYPPGIRLDRECTEEGYKLNEITLKKGLSVAVPVYAIHHNPEFYPNPNVFDPERFSPENKNQRNPFTYLPFGAGPRNCIAARFALLEVKLITAYLLYNYRLQICDKTQSPLNVFEGSGLLKPKSVALTLQKRLDKPDFE